MYPTASHPVRRNSRLREKVANVRSNRVGTATGYDLIGRPLQRFTAPRDGRADLTCFEQLVIVLGVSDRNGIVH